MSNVAKKEEQQLPIFRPAADVIEHEDGFHIYLDMPGVDTESLDLDLNEGELVVTGTAKVEPLADVRATHLEFGPGIYRRAFTLSDSVDREEIAANLKNGVLEVALPKRETMQPRRIEIQAG